MSVDEFKQQVMVVFEQSRDSLARIEELAQKEMHPEFHRLSQAYAQLLAPLRDFMSSAQMGRPQPRQLAARLGDFIERLGDLETEVILWALHPDAKELDELARLATETR